MRGEKFPGSQERPKTLEDKRLFEYVTQLLGYKVVIGVEDGPEKITAEINSLTKEANVTISPEGVKAACEFIKESGALQSVTKSFEGTSDVLRRRLERYIREKKTE